MPRKKETAAESLSRIENQVKVVDEIIALLEQRGLIRQRRGKKAQPAIRREAECPRSGS